MNWNSFKSKFHKSWHASVKPFIESKECDKIYNFLKSQKGKEIAPKSTLTFRSFERPLKDIKCVVFLEEPYSKKENEIQYADGIPLSCSFVERIHTELNSFYDAMETEFYDMNLNAIKLMNLDFYLSQGVLFLTSSLTTEINKPGAHKGLWVEFNKNIIKVFIKRKIPIIFCGENVYKEYKDNLNEKHPVFVIKQSLNNITTGIPWNTENKFTELNNYLWNSTDSQEIMWVNLDVPY